MQRKYAMTSGIMAFMVAVGIMVLMMAAVTGCSSGQETERANAGLSTEKNEADRETKQQNQSEEGKNDIPKSDIPENSTFEDDSSESSTPENNSSENAIPGSEMMCIGGKVRSIAEDSFVISRTLMDEDSSIVIMPEEGNPEEELVTIRCTDSTVFEHWTIQGGGAGITKEEASFSDIQRGGGLEAEGYFDGEEFVAEKVIIEEDA